jgi:hypothetical protein
MSILYLFMISGNIYAFHRTIPIHLDQSRSNVASEAAHGQNEALHLLNVLFN